MMAYTILLIVIVALLLLIWFFPDPIKAIRSPKTRVFIQKYLTIERDGQIDRLFYFLFTILLAASFFFAGSAISTQSTLQTIQTITNDANTNKILTNETGNVLQTVEIMKMQLTTQVENDASQFAILWLGAFIAGFLFWVNWPKKERTH